MPHARAARTRGRSQPDRRPTETSLPARREAHPSRRTGGIPRIRSERELPARPTLRQTDRAGVRTESRGGSPAAPAVTVPKYEIASDSAPNTLLKTRIHRLRKLMMSSCAADRAAFRGFGIVAPMMWIGDRLMMKLFVVNSLPSALENISTAISLPKIKLPEPVPRSSLAPREEPYGLLFSKTGHGFQVLEAWIAATRSWPDAHRGAGETGDHS